MEGDPPALRLADGVSVELAVMLEVHEEDGVMDGVGVGVGSTHSVPGFTGLPLQSTWTVKK